MTHDYSFSFRGYSEDLYPLADDLVRYLNDFVSHFELNVQYDTQVTYISRAPETRHFVLTDADGVSLSRLVDGDRPCQAQHPGPGRD